jgi:hypothetical protein
MPDCRIGAHHPALVRGMQVNRSIAESAAPLDHGRVKMRMRDRDRRNAAQSLDQGDGCGVNE